jgi:hypothetical protein
MTTPANGKTPHGDLGDRKTTSVRIERDLARMAATVASHDGRAVADILSPQLRPWVVAQYQRVRDEMAAELKGGAAEYPEKRSVRQGGERGTASVQVHADVARMAATIAAHDEVSIPQLLSPQLRAFLRKEYARVQKEIDAELGKGPGRDSARKGK